MDIPGSQFVNGKLLCTNRVDSVHYDPNRGLVSITWSYDFADNNLNASVAADKRTAKMHFMLDATGSKLIAVEEEHLHDADEAYAKKRIQEHLVMKRSPILNTMTMSAQTYGVRVK